MPVFIHLFEKKPASGCEVTPHGDFDWHFLNSKMILSIFMMMMYSLAVCAASLEKYLFKDASLFKIK